MKQYGDFDTVATVFAAMFEVVTQDASVAPCATEKSFALAVFDDDVTVTTFGADQPPPFAPCA